MDEKIVNIDNIAQHWLDSADQDFYKLCTKDFTDTWISRIKTIEKWLKSQL